MSAPSQNQKSHEVEITPEMIEAGVRFYSQWEPGHIFGEEASPYAIRELVEGVFREMLAVSNILAPSKNGSSRRSSP